MPRSHKTFSLGPLGGHKVHKMVKFRPRGMVDKGELEQAQLFETADERGCTPMFGAAHRRASAVPYPWRYEVCSLGPLGGHKVHKMVKFRPRGMVDKREMEQAQLFETADERGCTPMFGAAHRRGSASIGGSLPSAV